LSSIGGFFGSEPTNTVLDPTSTVIQHQTLSSADTLTAILAPAGGLVAHFRPK
jgi:hypothetical protein